MGRTAEERAADEAVASTTVVTATEEITVEADEDVVLIVKKGAKVRIQAEDIADVVVSQ